MGKHYDKGFNVKYLILVRLFWNIRYTHVILRIVSFLHDPGLEYMTNYGLLDCLANMHGVWMRGRKQYI